jgi:hypothetical protein
MFTPEQNPHTHTHNTRHPPLYIVITHTPRLPALVQNSSTVLHSGVAPKYRTHTHMPHFLPHTITPRLLPSSGSAATRKSHNSSSCLEPRRTHIDAATPCATPYTPHTPHYVHTGCTARQEGIMLTLFQSSSHTHTRSHTHYVSPINITVWWWGPQ